MKTDANQLFDYIKEKYSVKKDSHLSRDLEVSPSAISIMRKGTIDVGPTLILRIHEAYGMPVKRIRELLK